VQNGRLRLDSAGEAADGGMPPRRRRVEARARAAAKAMAAEPETSDKEQGFLVVTRTNGPGLFASWNGVALYTHSGGGEQLFFF
jgi:hypothetical protein